MSDSITDELTEALAETRGMRVVARASAFQFKGKGEDIREIGRRLNVGAILESSVRRIGGNLELASDGHLRHVEAEIAGPARRALLPAQRDSMQELHSTDNPEAHTPGGLLLYQGDAAALNKALDLARKAVTLDPPFVRAHWLIVKAEHNLAGFGLESPGEAERKSSDSLRAVLALDGGLPAAHTHFAFGVYVADWDSTTAERDFRAALAGGGSDAKARNLYGWLS